MPTKVTTIYHRRVADMITQNEEIIGTTAEGCELLELHTPVHIATNEDNTVRGVVVQIQIID